ncbi:phage tail protein [Pseudomonas cichorii]|uniref:phage tail protein n=1 Tax=Pseudomonas cichorii TaxID=36746 RepID=UPI001604D578|nr:phage tail protein [Pseudomonas cichorii]
MTTANSQFFAILTKVGEAKQANANALGLPWTFSQMGVGDANLTDPVPDREQNRLINEKRRAPLNQIKIDAANPNVIIAEQVIPPDVGGWWIREIGLYDADGDLVAVANCAPSFKPTLSQGTGKTQVVRLNIIVTSTANVQLKIDPSVVLATRDYVDTLILNILPPNKKAGTYTQVQFNERGVMLRGWNPTTLVGYGITDALSKSGGSLAGNLWFEPDFNLYLQPGSVNGWTAGLLATDKQGAIRAGVGFGGSADGSVLNAFFGLGETPWSSGKGVRVTAAGVQIEGQLTAVGSGLTGVPWSGLTDVPQAAEAKLGLAKVATTAQVNAGADDAVIVTPKKLRAGFSALLADNGYIALPSWLGGVIFQWGRVTNVPKATDATDAVGPTQDLTLPLTFPGAPWRALATMNYTTMGTRSAFTPGCTIVSNSVIRVQNNYTGSGGQICWFAIGN